MPSSNTYRKKSMRSKQQKGTRKNTSSSTSSIASFQKQITIKFMEILLMVKLYHWKTHSYATHKATDDLYGKLNENIDQFMEVLLGKSGIRTDLMKQKTIKLIDLNSQDTLKREIDSFKSYLVSLEQNPGTKTMSNTDLFNIRDEILGNLNQFLYLLTLK